MFAASAVGHRRDRRIRVHPEELCLADRVLRLVEHRVEAARQDEQVLWGDRGDERPAHGDPQGSLVHVGPVFGIAQPI